MQRINTIINKKYFYEIYAAIICLISFFTWSLFPTIGLCVIMILMAVALYVTNDFKYALPQLVNFIFVNGNNFSSRKIPIDLIVSGLLLIISLVVYVIRNRKRIFIGRFSKSFIPLAIIGIIPIFWSAIRQYDGINYMYMLYFSWTFYFLVYFLIVNLVKGNIIRELCICLSYMATLIALECVVEMIKEFSRFGSIFDAYYQLGWGVCNEAGIMMCVALPFIFYLIYIEDFKIKIVNSLKIALLVVGVLFTTSRASYLIFALEFIISFIVLCIKSKYKKQLIISMGIIVAVCTIVLFIKQDIIYGITDKVFKSGLSGNGRKELFQKAIYHYTKSPKTVIFGDGIVNEFFVVWEGSVWDDGSLRFYVYHSTIFQTLATMGTLGMIALIYHFIQKYKIIFEKKTLFSVFTFISFIFVDIYGMIDNTYHMCYYMIILIIILGIIEISLKNEGVKENE